MVKFVNIFCFILSIFCETSNIHSQSITWQRLYNGQSNSYDNGRGLCEATNGNIYLTGFLSSGRAIILKLKPNGDTIWTKYFNGIKGHFILSTGDGGCIITGEALSVFTLKLDSNGNTVWLKTYEDSQYIIPTDMIKTSDGGYAITGYQPPSTPSPAYVLKIDSLGDLKWQRYFYAGDIKVFYSISEKPNGNYIISGLKYKYKLCNGYSLLLELNNSGDSLWEKKYNLFADFKKIYAYNNEYLIAGTIIDSPYVFINSFIMRTNLSGDITFKKDILYNNREDLKDMKIINNNKYVIACDTDTLDRRSAGVYIIDSLGNVLHRNIFYVTDYSLFFSILSLPNSDIVFSGTVDTHLIQGRDIFAVRSDSTLFAAPIGIKQESNLVIENYELFQNYPNPFNPVTRIKYKIPYNSTHIFKIKIYDVLGKTIASYDIHRNSSSEIMFNGNDLSSGIYFYSLIKDNNIIETKKMLYIQ